MTPVSPDISTLSAKVTFDISGVNPLITLVNQSTGNGLANVSWWFVVTSPTNSPIHAGTETQPDIPTAEWTNYVISDQWPKPSNQIEWSGAPYLLTMYAKDSNGNIYSVNYTAAICRPFGNTDKSTNTYGLATTSLSVKCEQARLYFQNVTNGTYKGLTGTLVSSTLRVIYPIDETQNIPAPFSITNFSTALVPISYSSDNYQYVSQQVYDYDLGNNTFIRVKYSITQRFPVYCNIDLMPLICEYTKYMQQVECGDCVDAVAATKKLMLMNSKMVLVFTGIIQPLNGIDVPKYIKEVEAIGGFNCNCCSAPTGIIPTTSSVIDGYTFSVVNQGGDINGSFTTTGTNIQLNLADKEYVFNISQATLDVTDAFSVIPTTSTYLKTYSLNVDLGILAADLATTIAADGTLLNQWKTILGIGGGTQISVDGGCIFQSTSTCNYSFIFSNIPVNTTYSILSSITIGTTPTTLSYSFNQTNLSGLQTYLNGLGLGAFVVTNLGSNNVGITTTANPNNITALKYKISGTTYTGDLTKECTGYVEITLDEFAANIVNYICQLNDSNIVTSQGYQICYIDGLGAPQTIVLDAGVSLQTLMSSLTLNGCQTIRYIMSLGKVDCASIKTVFQSNSSLIITGDDFLLGTKGNGACSRPSYLEVFQYGLRQTITDATTLNLFCNAVTACGAGLPCEPYTSLAVIVTPYNTTCTQAVGIEYVLS